MTEHYFTDSPAASDAERRPRQLTLAGREVTVETAGASLRGTHIPGTEAARRELEARGSRATA